MVSEPAGDGPRVVPDDAVHPDVPERPPLRPGALRERLVAPAGPLARLEVVPESTSTNTELARAVADHPEAWPAPALLVAEHQAGGKGRLGRAWTTPPRAALLGSLLLRPDVPRGAFSWLPLLAGLATVRAVRATTGVEVVLKWPNDVLAPDPAPSGAEPSGPREAPVPPGPGTLGNGLRKVAGILAEVLPDGGVVVGIGINVDQTRAELPVPTATSLALAGAVPTDRGALLVALQDAVHDVVGRWQDAGGDAHAAALDADVAGVCATLGTRVRVERVGGDDVVGTAVGLARDGGLVVEHDDGTTSVQHSGDVHHLRPHPTPGPGPRARPRP